MCIEVYLNRKREKGKYPLPRSNILIFLQVAVVHFLIIIWYLFRLLFTILEYNIIVCCPMNGCQNIFCQKTLHTYALFVVYKS